MKNNQTNLNKNIDEDSIDLIAIIKKIWSNRKLILSVSALFFIIGCIVALSSPVVYTSQTTFVPQVSDEQNTPSGGLGSLASLAGIYTKSSQVTVDSYLSPLLYSKLAESEEFSLKIIEEEIINLKGEKLSIREYLLTNKSSFNFNPLGFIKSYTIGLFVNNEPKVNSNIIENDYNFLSDEDFSLINSFKQKFKLEINDKQGYIKVIAFDKSAFISSQLVEKVTKILQSNIIELRTNKIKERLEYSKEQYELKQAEFDLLQKKLAEFKDSNKSISTARFMSELQKLETEYQLQENILITLASEYNNNKIKLNKDTPIFSVIDEVSIPNQRSKPQRSLIVITYVFLGLVLSVGFILAKEPIIDLVKEIIE